MLRFAAPIAFAATFISAPLWAQETDSARTDALFDALGIPGIIEIMREEGLSYGETLAVEMLAEGPSEEWNSAVSAIYDVDVMQAAVRGAFGQAIEGADIDAILSFFTSEQGERIVGLEVSARRALLDEAIEEASRENALIAMTDETPRFRLVEEFVRSNDLIEANVAGSLNSSYAFYVGLIDGGAMPAGITPDVALQDVWAKEPQVRSDTIEWLYSFLLMAYQPLSDSELEAYIAFSQTEAGQDLTNALFAAFNGTFDDISRALGLVSARFMMLQEL